ncbi:MAG: PqqD family protein [Clostridia bacterium]|nr:PqqD family protein [Clostridia bacterium]
MKLKYEFVIMDMGEEFAAVPVGEDVSKFRGMLKLNAVSADILEQLKEDTTPEKVHAYLKEKYSDSTDDEIGNVLAEFLSQLVSEGLLDDRC